MYLNPKKKNQLFLTLFTILSVVCSLFTEAIKKTIGTKEPTLVALILSAVIGWGGSAVAYKLMNVPFDTNSIICLTGAFAIFVKALVKGANSKVFSPNNFA